LFVVFSSKKFAAYADVVLFVWQVKSPLRYRAFGFLPAKLIFFFFLAQKVWPHLLPAKTMELKPSGNL
jgi:hypothetical protein